MSEPKKAKSGIGGSLAGTVCLRWREKMHSLGNEDWNASEGKKWCDQREKKRMADVSRRGAGSLKNTWVGREQREEDAGEIKGGGTGEQTAARISKRR